MYKILVSDAISVVRKNLDEQGLNDSLMYIDENKDNNSMDSIIEQTLPEAINRIHAIAPVAMLEGEDITVFKEIKIEDKVLYFSIDCDYLRLVSFKTKDTNKVVTQVNSEDSVIGRKQLNKYICGRYDKPVLVMLQGSWGVTKFRYYSLKDDTYTQRPYNVIEQLKVISRQKFKEGREWYLVSSNLVENSLNMLTSMVLSIYGANDKAKYFYDLVKVI